MNLIKKLAIVFIIIGSFFSCCESRNATCDYILNFSNNTNKILKIYRNHGYPDTLAVFSPESTYFVEPNSSIEIRAGSASCKQLDCWEPLFGSDKYGAIPSGVLMIGIVDQNDIDTYGIEYVKSNYMLIKRYDLTLQNLQDMNWKIVCSE